MVNSIHFNGIITFRQTFGTPLQDALRRDTTINALFYNVHTRRVEDFTGKVIPPFRNVPYSQLTTLRQGLEDLRNGTIRTPLPPRETFLDDPLRVLRCIRFACRYGFDMVPEVEEAAKDPVIQVLRPHLLLAHLADYPQEALVSKVARERAGEELSKMLKGDRYIARFTP